MVGCGANLWSGTARDMRGSVERNLKLGLVLGLVAALGLIYVLFAWLQPPKRMTIAAGSADGAYYRIAAQYRDILARDGIAVDVLETAGSADNAALLAAGDVDAALIQGGVAVDGAHAEAIAKVFFEPMMFIVGAGANVPTNPAAWSGLHINVGAQGSGTRLAWQDFERAVGLDPGRNTVTDLGYTEAVAALADGALDLALFVAPIEAPYLVTAYANPELRVLALRYVEAISRRLDYARIVTVPAGAISLIPAHPPAPRELIALEARLAIADNLHPALVNRLTMAAIELHQTRGMITDQGTFPSVEGVGMPLNNAARQLILNGPSIWHDWLPYWMASQVHRMVLLVLPILLLVLPLLRTMPAAYAFVMRWRVWTHYPEIRDIERAVEHDHGRETLAALDARLADLDERLSQLGLPAAYRQAAYDARLHIDLVRRRIADLREVP